MHTVLCVMMVYRTARYDQEDYNWIIARTVDYNTVSKLIASDFLKNTDADKINDMFLTVYSKQTRQFLESRELWPLKTCKHARETSVHGFKDMTKISEN